MEKRSKRTQQLNFQQFDLHLKLKYPTITHKAKATPIAAPLFCFLVDW